MRIALASPRVAPTVDAALDAVRRHTAEAAARYAPERYAEAG